MTDKELIACFKEILQLNLSNAQTHAIERVINMLTPKAVIGRHTQCTCPVCGRRIRSGNGSSLRVRDKRCQDCGQVIGWAEFDKREHTWWKSKESEQ